MAKGDTWTIRSSASDSSWVNSCYDDINKNFVAVAQGGQAMYSTDKGVTWNVGASVGTAWRGCASAKGITLSVAQGGLITERVMKSTDGGVTWAFKTAAELVGYQSVGYAAGTGTWIAVAESGAANRIMRSTDDGETWASIAEPSAVSWTDVMDFNGTWVAVAYDSPGSAIMTSDDDGLTWQMQTTPTNNLWFRLTASASVMVSASFGGSGDGFMTSTDGKNWTVQVSPCDAFWVGLAYGDGVFVASASNNLACTTGTRIITSSDGGVTWVSQTTPADNSWQSVAFGDGVFISTAQSGVGNRVMTSGITDWTGDGADLLASTSGNWDGGVPSATNRATYTGTNGGSPLKDCTMDIGTLLGVGIHPGYTGDITNSVIVSLLTDYLMDGGGGNNGAEYITNGFDMYVDGDFTSRGTNEGTTHNAGGTLYLGGNADVDNGQGKQYTSPVVFHHSKATPTAAKTHTVFDWSRANSMADDVTFGDNQTIILAGNFNGDLFTFGDNTEVTDDISFGAMTLTVRSPMVDPDKCNWNPTAINKIVILHFTATNPTAADYGSCELEFRTTNINLTGTWVTLGDALFRKGAGGTNNYTLTGSLSVRNVEIGDSASTTQAAALTQVSGSSLQMSGTLSIFEDDGIQTNIWTRLAGTLNTVISGDLIVETLAAIDFSLDSSTIAVAGVINISTTAVCDFGSTTVRHSGDIQNAGFSNKFNTLQSDTSTTPIVLTDDIGANRWLFTGVGSIDTNGMSMSIRFDGAQLTGADSVSFVGIAGSIKFLTSSGAGGGAMTIPGADYNSGAEIRRSGAGLRTLTILGNTTFNGVVPRDFTVALNGFTLNCTAFSNTAGAYIIDLQSGLLNISGNLLYADAANQLNGPGTLIVGADIQHTAGTLNINGVNVTAVDYEPSAGVTLTNNTGSMTLSGNYNLANNVFTSNSAGGILRFNGGAVQDYNLGGGVGPSTLSVEKSAGLVAINDDQGSATTLSLNAGNGNASAQFIGGNTYNFNTILGSGVTGNKTLMVSDVGGVQYIINLTTTTPVLRYVGIEDSDFANVIQRVDTLTGSDDGNNVLAGANGLLFAAVALSSEAQVFQASRLDILKNDVDIWMLTNSDNHIFTAAYLQIQEEVRGVNRLFTLTLFYNGDGIVLANPFVLNYSDGPVLADVNAGYEDSVVANPVAATFYANMFVHKSDLARKSAIYNYLWLTNDDEVLAPSNWTAENAIT